MDPKRRRKRRRSPITEATGLAALEARLLFEQIKAIMRTGGGELDWPTGDAELGQLDGQPFWLVGDTVYKLAVLGGSGETVVSEERPDEGEVRIVSAGGVVRDWGGPPLPPEMN